jgi:hypothetical protein
VPDIFPLPGELIVCNIAWCLALCLMCTQDLVLARSAGNPKNIEEILGQLLSEKAIEERDGRVYILSDNLSAVGVVPIIRSCADAAAGGLSGEDRAAFHQRDRLSAGPTRVSCQGVLPLCPTVLCL